MPQYQFTRARDVAPSFFDNLQRIREIDQARTQRQRALQQFAMQQQQLQARRRQANESRDFISSILGSPSNPSYNVRLGRELAAQRGWSGGQWNALYTLGMRESGWKNTAQNPTSTAYGIGQFLDKTWGTVGGRKTSDPKLQIEYMLRYIAQRYGDPIRAINFWNRNHWY